MLFAIATLVVAFFSIAGPVQSQVESHIRAFFVFSVSNRWLRTGSQSESILPRLDRKDDIGTRYGRNNTTVQPVNVQSREFLPLHIWRIFLLCGIQTSLRAKNLPEQDKRTMGGVPGQFFYLNEALRIPLQEVWGQRLGRYSTRLLASG